MPLQASVFMLFEQVAALDFPKWHFDRHKVAFRKIKTITIIPSSSCLSHNGTSLSRPGRCGMEPNTRRPPVMMNLSSERLGTSLNAGMPTMPN